MNEQRDKDPPHHGRGRSTTAGCSATPRGLGDRGRHEQYIEDEERLEMTGCTTDAIPDTVDVSPPIVCHGSTRDSMFGLQRMRNSTVNARDSRFILVRALDRDRVIALCLVGISLCVGLIVKCCVALSSVPPI